MRSVPLLALAGYAAGYFAYDFLDQHVPGPVLDFIGMLTGYENIQQDAWKLSDPCRSTGCKILSLGDMALNGALGIATILGIGSGIKSIQAARAMQSMSIAQRLNYLQGLAGAAGVEVQLGSSFYRPLGSRFIWLHGGALDDAWRLAGGFFHELAHVGQEFGTSKMLRWIPQGLQWLSERSTKGIGWVLSPLGYWLNPVEIHAAASGLSYWQHVAWLSIIRPAFGEVLQQALYELGKCGN